ncbi:hypothetical protein [Gimesia algae]|uniref:Uncharacterized protein n=1 Tax=Gimesia algae TaxID=2527971 RepID=A0A517VGA5_9PLAN|nr:hypothetical protein [Gimesia algae]QDT92058.1 hypothetical protein Pan161_37220 [Gimesia algae]
MKNLLPLLTTVACLLGSSHAQAAIEAQKPDSHSETTTTETTPQWIVQISPAPGVNSYATRETRFPLMQSLQPADKKPDSKDLIIIAPREIPDVQSTAVCENCTARQTPINRSYYLRSMPWYQNSTFARLQGSPANYMYGDLIRSNWFGSPYQGNTFYYNGYRPSFRFGSLQFRGFGNYDRMYNPRIIPFGYQFAGLQDFYTALAWTSMFPSLP